MAAAGAEGLVLQRDGHRGQTELTGFQFGRADVEYLSSPAGIAALAEADAIELTDRTRLADIAALRTRFADRTPVLVETTLLRRRATAKLAGLAEPDWLFTDEALQQASAAPVALHRAGRVAAAHPDAVVHDVTCSVGTELAALHRCALTAVGSDLDPVRLAMARHNLAGAATLLRADALRPVTRGSVVFADPARRDGDRRRVDPAAYRPALDALLAVYDDREFAVKCSPGMDFDQIRRLGFTGEIEVTSWRGSVREACLWSRPLSAPGVGRRATVLDSGEQFTDTEPDDCPVRPAGRWIVDPDGAVVRAGLVRQYAARHGLAQLDPEIAYLTGDTLPAGVRGFEVLDQLDYREDRLRRALTAMDCGPLEILARGVREVRADPDGLRRRLRLRGSRALSVVITRIGAGHDARATAFICQPSR